MSNFLAFVVAGITIGSTLGLVAIGLVLTYRTSGILNFAQGALAIVAVDAYIWFTVNRGWSWQTATICSVLGVGAVMGLALSPFGRVLSRAPAGLQVVATIGLLLAIESASNLILPKLPGTTPHFVAPPMPYDTVKIGGVYVGKDQLIIMGVAAVCALALSAFLRFTRLGLAMRAVVSNPELLDLAGTRATVVRRWAWIIGSTFAALSGVLLALAPTFGPSPQTVEMIVIPSFAAAALAAFTSLPLAYVGGLAVGVVSSLLVRYITPTWLGGLPTAAPYLILLVALFFIPKKRLARAAASVPVARLRDIRLPNAVNVGLAGVLVVVVLAIPSRVGFSVTEYSTTLAYVVLFLSLGLLLKTGNLVSLCQMAFAAVGATTFSRLVTDAGLPWGVAVVGGMAVAAAVGVVVALSAVRLSGVFLALGTLAFGFLMQTLAYPTNLMFSGPAGETLRAARPSFASSDRSYYYLVAGIVAVCIAVVIALDRSRLGRLLHGAADSNVAMQVQGASTMVSNLTVFGISAALAGLFGALLAGQQTFVVDTPYGATASLTLVVLVFIVRLEHPWYAIVAAIVFYQLPLHLDVAQPSSWTQLAGGSLAVVTVVWGVSARKRRRHRREPVPVRDTAAAGVAAAPLAVSAAVASRSASAGGEGPVLEVVGLTVRFGGLTALDDVSLRAPTGAITGLIGPNGAGKSTLLNVCTGQLRPNRGHVLFGGRDLARSTSAARARRGIGRTFQRPELFDSLTVREATALAREASTADRNPIHHVFGAGTGHGDGARATDDAIELAGIGDLLDVLVGELSTADRRLVELARCLSGDFELLLLDEPTSGLDREESDRLVTTLRTVVDTRGVGVLLVEHDMGVVMESCDRITVLDFGTLLFEGTPDEVLASEEVRAAYLGDAALDVTT